MRYGSLCSGIEAASVAWEPLGWQPAWFAEIEPFPAAVLKHHWPHVPNRGDMSKFKEWPNEPINLLVGGTPCQSFSVAGLRRGLADPRGNLMLTYLAIANQYRPEWLVWENVPGVLSSNRGRDFATFLNGLAELGYGFAYRILDAQYFGVPQRRRRIFVVGRAGSWQRAAAVLFERESLQGHLGQGRAPQENPTATTNTGSHWDDPGNPHPTLNQSSSGGILERSNQEIFSQRGSGLIPVRMRGFGDYTQDDTASTVKARDYKDATDLIIVHGNIIGKNPSGTSGGGGMGAIQDGTCYTLTTIDRHAVSDGFQVRRITPLECERLQGFPDYHTRIPWRGKPAADCPDGPRYKAIGNSMAVPVMRWIGERIIDRIHQDNGYLFLNSHGKPLSRAALSRQFLELRKTVMQQRPELAEELSAFQFRDLRAKAATDIYLAADTRSASDQLGHASERMTKTYIRRGKILKPLK